MVMIEPMLIQENQQIEINPHFTPINLALQQTKRLIQI